MYILKHVDFLSTSVFENFIGLFDSGSIIIIIIIIIIIVLQLAISTDLTNWHLKAGCYRTELQQYTKILPKESLVKVVTLTIFGHDAYRYTGWETLT
jgi:flagellar basal body-associated protein FliL